MSDHMEEQYLQLHPDAAYEHDYPPAPRRVGFIPLPAAHASLKVVGVSFVDGYPQNFYDLDALRLQQKEGEQLKVVLIRNPQNRYDTNAIEVHVPALGSAGMVGHLPKEIAVRLAPELDSGVEWSAHVEQVLIAQGRETNPGLLIGIERIGQREGT